MMYEQKIRLIAEHYGTENQLVQMAEESAELGHAALRFRRAHYGKPIDLEAMRVTRLNLIEEIADEMIMIEQICERLGCEQAVKDVVAEKLDRQLERIGKAGNK